MLLLLLQSAIVLAAVAPKDVAVVSVGFVVDVAGCFAVVDVLLLLLLQLL